MNQNKTLCIAEWQTFGVEDIKSVIASEAKGEAWQSIPKSNDEKSNNDNKTPEEKELAKKIDEKAQKFFDELKIFADEKGNHIFLNSYGKNRLKARNFVGFIQTKSGFCLEILPKTFRTARDSEGFAIKNCTCSSLRGNETDETIQNGVDCHADKSARNDNSKSQKCEVCKAKQILLDMLKTLKNSPFKQSRIATLKTQHLPLLEVFAIMFLDELERLIKKGIKSDYVACEENRYFLKGKLLFTQNLKHNFAHKERFFTQSDEFIADIALNRLIVSTLLFLSRCGFSAKTSTRLMQSRFVFDEIAPSQNYDKDFAKCTNLKRFKSYELILLWCKVFLKRQSFTAYEGSEKAFALLFDMNKLFESFVAHHLKKHFASRKCKYEIKAQDKSRHLLFEKNKEKSKFQIIPDLVCRKIKDKNQTLFIADTKWKIVDENKQNSNIEQSDLYQMFAYLTKYQCNKGYLIYSKIAGNESIKHKKFIYKAQICFYDKNLNLHKKQDIALKICFFDLEKAKDSKKCAIEL